MAFDLGKRAASVAALACVVALAASARAEPSAADRETARTYMAEGRQKRDANDLRAALRAFEAADAIMHVPTTRLEVARTQALLGLLVEARDAALEVARSTPRPHEPVPFVEARTAAQKLAAELEGRIPTLRITVPHAPPGLTVSIDGATLPAIAIGLGRKLDPGDHVVVASAGDVTRTVRVQVLERESKEVSIDLGAPEPTAPVASTPNEPRRGGDTPSAGHGPWLGLGIVGISLGGVGVVIGAITGAMSISQTNTIGAQCNAGVCPPTLSDGSSTSSALSSARGLATVSDIGFIAGGVLAAAGLTFVLVGSSHSHPSAVALTVGPGSVGVGGTF